MGAFEASRPSGTEAAAVARRYRRAGAADFDPSPAPPSDPPTTQIPIVEAPEDKQRARFGSDNDEDSEAALIDPAAPDSSVDESDAFDSADEAEFGHLFGGKNRRYNNSGKRGKERAARGVEGRAAGNANDGDGDDDEDDDGRPTRRASSGSASASQDVGTEEEWGGDEGEDPVEAALAEADAADVAGQRRAAGRGMGSGSGSGSGSDADVDLGPGWESDDNGRPDASFASDGVSSSDDGGDGIAAVLSVGGGGDDDGNGHSGRGGCGGRGGARVGPDRLSVRDEHLDEAEWNAPGAGEVGGGSGDGGGDGGVSLADLLGGLGGEAPRVLGKSRAALEKLARRETKAARAPSGSGAASLADAPPVAGPALARAERRAARERANAQVDGWTRVVKAAREAPTLDFRGPGRGRGSDAAPRTVAALAAGLRPALDAPALAEGAEGGSAAGNPSASAPQSPPNGPRAALAAMEARVHGLLARAGASDARAVAKAEDALASLSVCFTQSLSLSHIYLSMSPFLSPSPDFTPQAAQAGLSAEETRERRDRLARTRALMFYHEEKLRRLKKIKSKDHARHLKKAALTRAKREEGRGGEGATGAEATLAAAEAGDPEAKAEIRKAQEEAAYKRAEERLTLRHKHTSRWARRALRRGSATDEGTRAALREQIALADALRKRAVGGAPGSGSSDEGSDDGLLSDDTDRSSGSEEDPAAGSRRASGGLARERLLRRAALEILDPAAAAAAGGDGLPLPAAVSEKDGLLGMPFMIKARERARREAEEAAREALRDLDGDTGVGSASADARSGGRLAFGSNGGGGIGAASAKPKPRINAGMREDGAFTDGETDNDSEDSDGNGDRAMPAATAAAAAGVREVNAATATGHPSTARPLGARTTTEMGPGGAEVAAATTVVAAAAVLASQRSKGRRANSAGVGGGAETGTTAATAPTFQRARRFTGARPGFEFKTGNRGTGYYSAIPAEDPRPAAPRAVVAAPLPRGIAAVTTAATDEAKAPGMATHADLSAPLDTAGSESSDDDAPAMRLVRGSAGSGALDPAALVGLALAGDNHQQSDFAKMKEKDEELELPPKPATEGHEAGTVPGWGAWSGDQRGEPRWAKARRERAEMARAEARSARADADRSGVYIADRWDKKAERFSVPHVPHGHGSVAAYEASLRQPIGREFNTDKAFRDMTRPVVLADAGVIIRPAARGKGKGGEAEDADVGLGVRDASGTAARPKKRRGRATAAPLGVKRARGVTSRS